MPPETALPHNYLIVAALLLGIGVIGLLSRRNMVVTFLSSGVMLQGVLLSLVAWGRFHHDAGGQVLLLLAIAVAGGQAAVAAALAVAVFRRSRVREGDSPIFPAGKSVQSPGYSSAAPKSYRPQSAEEEHSELPPEQTGRRPHV